MGDVGPGAPSVREVFDEGDADRVRKAGELMHAIDYVLITRAPHVFETIQVYRDQYRMARSFIVPSVALALVVPFWAPVRELGGARLGPTSGVGVQLSLLGVLIACVTFLAFRERVFRYAAARVMGYAAVQADGAG